MKKYSSRVRNIVDETNDAVDGYVLDLLKTPSNRKDSRDEIIFELKKYVEMSIRQAARLDENTDNR